MSSRSCGGSFLRFFLVPRFVLGLREGAALSRLCLVVGVRHAATTLLN